MNMDAIPIWGLFAGTIFFVLFSIEAGYRLGRIAHRRSEDEKESPVSAIAGSTMGLLAFMLAFTFGMVTDRYDARKALVRDEANAIGAAYLRSAFLPEPERSETSALFKEYIEQRLTAVKTPDSGRIHLMLTRADQIQKQLWNIAVTYGRANMNSDIAALYINALNEVIDIHALRVAVGLQQRIPNGIWIVLYGLMCCGMMAIGYQTGIAGSKRSWARPILAISFGMVIALIAALDRPQSGYVRVSHQPLIDLQKSLNGTEGEKK